jgi:hypothetical protein
LICGALPAKRVADGCRRSRCVPAPGALHRQSHAPGTDDPVTRSSKCQPQSMTTASDSRRQQRPRASPRAKPLVAGAAASGPSRVSRRSPGHRPRSRRPVGRGQRATPPGSVQTTGQWTRPGRRQDPGRAKHCEGCGDAQLGAGSALHERGPATALTGRTGTQDCDHRGDRDLAADLAHHAVGDRLQIDRNC